MLQTCSYKAKMRVLSKILIEMFTTWK